MQKITVLSVGKLKEEYWRQAEGEYLKRLGGFCDIHVIELAQAPLPAEPSEGQIQAALAVEAEQLLARIPKNAEVVSLCVEGKQRSSERLSELIAQNADFGSGSMVFVIGGSFGLDEKVKRRSDLRLSMSEMTFPHRLARIMLLEQLYRAYQIQRGTRYHK